MTEECGKTTLVREVRKGEAVLYSSTPAVYSEKSNVRANVNALRYPRDIRCVGMGTVPRSVPNERTELQRYKCTCGNGNRSPLYYV